MHTNSGPARGQVEEASDAADPWPYLRTPRRAEVERNEGPRRRDDEGVIEQWPRDGSEAARGQGEEDEPGSSRIPVGPLVGGIAELPGAGVPQGKPRRQRARGHQGLGDGPEELGRQLVERPARAFRGVRCSRRRRPVRGARRWHRARVVVQPSSRCERQGAGVSAQVASGRLGGVKNRTSVTVLVLPWDAMQALPQTARCREDAL
jgi:hypothetical protein